MRGSVNWQINTIFKDSGIFQPGISRHSEKIAIKQQLKLAGQGCTSQNIADKTAMHGYEASDYKDTWHNFGHFCKQGLGIKDMTKIETRHVQSYMEKRIMDGIKYGTWNKEAAHLAKFGNALERFDGQNRGFRQAIDDTRHLAKDRLPGSDKDHGGFRSPEKVIQNLNGNHALAARIQHEGGARLREASLIKKEQLKGLQHDKIAGQQKGVIHLKDTKGGKPRDIQVSKETYSQLQHTIEENGKFQVHQKTYQSRVNAAAKLAGEQRTGTHDFRYNFAQNRYNQFVESDYNNVQAQQAVSWEMGHERADITKIYLR
jgi:integrase